jgi:low temperature requirement protein LtrA
VAPQHISERYGLFTLIVLGECVAAATVAMQSATSSGLSARRLAWRPAGCSSSSAVVVVLRASVRGRACGSRNLAFLWGYAHYAVFASVAALGAGLEVAVESTRGTGVSATTAEQARGIPRSIRRL